MKRLATLLVLIVLTIPISVLAKGPFTYLTIKGPGISGDLSVTNPALLDFFAFADFSKGGVEEPANPGDGYEVVRSFVEDNDKVQDFDLLHYYPDTGYVYYDGLINGGSEYDKQWYVARTEMEADFRSVLAERARLTWIPYGALVVMLIVFGVAYNRRPRQKV